MNIVWLLPLFIHANPFGRFPFCPNAYFGKHKNIRPGSGLKPGRLPFQKLKSRHSSIISIILFTSLFFGPSSNVARPPHTHSRDRTDFKSKTFSLSRIPHNRTKSFQSRVHQRPYSKLYCFSPAWFYRSPVSSCTSLFPPLSVLLDSTFTRPLCSCSSLAPVFTIFYLLTSIEYRRLCFRFSFSLTKSNEWILLRISCVIVIKSGAGGDDKTVAHVDVHKCYK